MGNPLVFLWDMPHLSVSVVQSTVNGEARREYWYGRNGKATIYLGHNIEGGRLIASDIHPFFSVAIEMQGILAKKIEEKI